MVWVLVVILWRSVETCLRAARRALRSVDKAVCTESRR